MSRRSFTLWLLLVSASIATFAVIAAGSTASEPDRPPADFAVVDAFFRVCVMAKDADDARARAQAFGRHSGESFELDLGGTPVKFTLGPPGVCMLVVRSINFERVLQYFAIELQRDHSPEDYRLIDDSEWEFDDFADDQSRPSLDGDPPTDAVVRRRVEVVSSRSLNVRLLVLSKQTTGTQGSVFLISEIHADAAKRRPPTPPRPPRRHSLDTPPSEEISGRLAFPPRYPEAALKACAYGEVRVRFRIDAAGAVLNVTIDQSSGNADLDKAAIEAARHWKFNPGSIEGHPVGGELIEPVRFENPCDSAN